MANGSLLSANRRPWSPRRVNTAWVLLVLAIMISPGNGWTRDGGVPPEGAEETQGAAIRWLDHLRECTRGVFSLEAEFSQETIHRLGGGSARLRGKATLRRGGKVRLEYTHPDKKVLVSNGVEFRAWLPGEDVMLVGMALDEDLLGAVTYLLGDGAISGFEHGTTRLLGPDLPVQEGNRGVVEVLVNRENRSPLRLLLTLEGTCPAIVRFAVVDGNGVATRMTFEKIKTNVAAGEGMFEIVVPPGTVVVKR